MTITRFLLLREIEIATEEHDRSGVRLDLRHRPAASCAHLPVKARMSSGPFAVYLASDESALTTGTIIRSMVDGPRRETLIFQRGLPGFEERLTRIEQDILVKQAVCCYPQQSVIIRGNPRQKQALPDTTM